jgi:hypothetical protein
VGFREEPHTGFVARHSEAKKPLLKDTTVVLVIYSYPGAVVFAVSFPLEERSEKSTELKEAVSWTY